MEKELTRDTAFLAAGLLATAAQVLLLRELVVDVAGDEAAVGIGLAAWFAGVAGGAVLARRRVRAGSAAASLAALAVLPACGVLLGRVLRSALAPSAGELPGPGLALALAGATLAPAGAAVGSAFAALAGLGLARRGPGAAVARLYVVESLGSVGGGLLITWLLGVHLLPLRLAALAGLVSAGLAMAGLPGQRRSLAGAAALCGAIVAAAAPLDRWSETVRFAATAGGVPLRATADTPYQHLALGGDDVWHLYASGQYVGSFPDPYAAETVGNLLALLAREPRRLLLIGGIERGLAPVLLRHGPERLTVLEPDAGALAFLEPRLPQSDREALSDRRVSVVVGDPRAALGAMDEQAFDLVVLLGPDPATLLRARLATVEFYRLVAARLAPQGVLVTSLPSAPTVLTGETEALAGAIVRAVREALPVVLATPGPDALLVAGRNPSAVTLDPARLAGRWRSRGVVSGSFDPALLPALLPAERVAQQQSLLAAAADRAPLSRDDRPVSFLHALARRQQLVSGGAGRLLARAFALPTAGLVALALLPSAWGLVRLLGRPAAAAQAAAATHAVAVSGVAGLGWSLVILFAFQTRAGALYGLLGTLVALFMLGLALGGGLASRFAASGAGGLHVATRALRLWLLAALAFALGLPLALAAGASAAAHGTAAVVAVHGALLLAAGLVTGGVFPLAVAVRLASGDTVVRAAGTVEAADHAGAAAGALFGAILFVPLLGLVRCALLLAVLLAFGVLAVAWAERRAAKIAG